MSKILHNITLSLLGNLEFTSTDIKLDPWLYPIDLDFTLEYESFYYTPKDTNGIPMRCYRSVGLQYNPTRVAAYGLAHWNRFRQTGKEENLEKFIKVLSWFAQVKNGIYLYNFDWNDLKAPWISCMAQGEAISILARGFLVTGDRTYLSLAQRALDPFTKPIAEGGVQSILDSGEVFLEEYPSEKPVHVLNGYLYALIGIIELKRLLDTNILRQLLNQAETTLNNSIHQWDLGYWSAYDQERGKILGLRNFSTASYHLLHISQIQFISRELPLSNLNFYASKWMANYKKIYQRVYALFGKIIYRVGHPPQR